MSVHPPNEAFEIEPNRLNPKEALVKAAAGYASSGHLATVFSKKNGGLYTYTQGNPYPRKGHVYPEAMLANNQVKRNTLAILHPYTAKGMRLPMLLRLLLPNKREFLEEALIHYIKSSDAIYRSVHPIPYLKEDHYKNCGRQLWRFTQHFLMALGITEDTAFKTGKIAATMIEYEDMYQLVMQDLASETTADKLLANPRRELLRLAGILAKRANIQPLTIGGKFTKLLKFGSLLLLLPKVKRAFKTALKQTDFPKLQLEDCDTYYCLINGNEYSFLGKNLEERKAIFMQMVKLGQLNLNINSMSDAVPVDAPVEATPVEETQAPSAPEAV